MTIDRYEPADDADPDNADPADQAEDSPVAIPLPHEQGDENAQTI